jgi:hypothetical protein
MTTGKLIAVIVIFIGASIAWAVLAARVYTQTQSADSSLRGQVQGLWGTAHTQKAPQVSATVTVVDPDTK